MVAMDEMDMLVGLAHLFECGWLLMIAVHYNNRPFEGSKRPDDHLEVDFKH